MFFAISDPQKLVMAAPPSRFSWTCAEDTCCVVLDLDRQPDFLTIPCHNCHHNAGQCLSLRVWQTTRRIRTLWSQGMHSIPHAAGIQKGSIVSIAGDLKNTRLWCRAPPGNEEASEGGSKRARGRRSVSRLCSYSNGIQGEIILSCM